VSELHVSVVAGDIRVRLGEFTLLTYVAAPAGEPSTLPTPHLHPLRTVRGSVVTAAGPKDHPWHQGVRVAVPRVGESNLWGGPTYVAGRGYVERGDQGRIQSAGRRSYAVTPDGDVEFQVEHRWIGRDGTPLLREVQQTLVRHNPARAEVWWLHLRTGLTNVRTEPLRLGSPGGAGRSGAGYGGIMWRGAAAFSDAEITTAEGTAGVPNGVRTRAVTFTTPEGPWVRLVQPGRIDPWFVRREEYPGAGPATRSPTTSDSCLPRTAARGSGTATPRRVR
jgi:hypothetical protein